MTGLTQRRPFGSSARQSPSCWSITTLCLSVTDQCSPAQIRCRLSVLLLLDSYSISRFEPFSSVSSCEQTFLFHLGRTQRWNFWEACVLNFVGKHQLSAVAVPLCTPASGEGGLAAPRLCRRCLHIRCSAGRQQGLVWFEQHFSDDEDVSISSRACWLFEFFFLKYLPATFDEKSTDYVRVYFWTPCSLPMTHWSWLMAVECCLLISLALW